jgi:hypothetical protein
VQHIKKAKIRKMIKSECEATASRKYKTTYKDIKKYFNLINHGVFHNELAPFNDIQIKDLTRQKVYGQVVIFNQKRKGTQQLKLEMSDKYSCFSEFVNTLGHEMVHLYQLQNCNDTGNHNSLFYSFKPRLKAIGLGQI